MPATNVVSRGDAPPSMMQGLGGSGFGSDSTPATPLEKYYILKDEYMRLGKEWRWEAMRDYVRDQYLEKGWPENHFLMRALETINDQDMGLAPERARLLRLDDRDAKAEAERAAAADRQRVMEVQGQQTNEASKDAQINELKAMVQQLLAREGAAVRNEPTALPAPAEDTTAAVEHARNAVEGPNGAGLPTIDWTKKAMVDWATGRGISVPEDLLANQFTPKAEVLNHVLTKLAEQDKE